MRQLKQNVESARQYIVEHFQPLPIKHFIMSPEEFERFHSIKAKVFLRLCNMICAAA